MEVLDAYARTRLPVLRSTATTVVLEAPAVIVVLLDQTADLDLLRRTKLPSVQIVNTDEAGLEIGVSLLAIHTGVTFCTLLYHIAIYHLSWEPPAIIKIKFHQSSPNITHNLL